MESSLSRLIKQRAKAAPHRGFTLVEMLVVLSIIAVITAIALIGQGDFNRSFILTDTTYTVALSMREMQTLGLASRKFGTVQNAGYGAYFAKATPGQYILFADTYEDPAFTGVPSNCDVGAANRPESKPGDCIYTAGVGKDGIVQTYTFSRGFTVSDFCGLDAGVRTCSSTGALTALSVAFLRSSTESMIEGQNSSGAWVPLTSAEVYINSGNGGTRAVCVSQVGQISVAFGQCL